MKTVFFLIKRKVLSYDMHLGSLRDFTRSIDVLRNANRSSSILLVSPTLLIKGSQDPKLDKALQNADILIPKGRLLHKSLMWLYRSDSESLSAEVLLDGLVRELELDSVFFIGEKKAYSRLSKKYPKVLLKEIEANKLSSLNSEVSLSSNRLLVVCLPSGDQEKWIEEAKESVNACIIGLGDFYYSQSFLGKSLNETAFLFKVLRQKLVFS